MDTGFFHFCPGILGHKEELPNYLNIFSDKTDRRLPALAYFTGFLWRKWPAYDMKEILLCECT